MKQLLNSAIKAMVILAVIFVIGMFIPMLITSFIVLFSSTQYDEIIAGNGGNTFAFWFFSLVGWIFAMLYMNDVINK